MILTDRKPYLATTDVPGSVASSAQIRGRDDLVSPFTFRGGHRHGSRPSTRAMVHAARVDTLVSKALGGP